MGMDYESSSSDSDDEYEVLLSVEYDRPNKKIKV